MAELQLLRAEHEEQVLAFERPNRAYFAASISDRGDDYFDHFADQHGARLREQAAGEAAYYVLVDAEGSILGRFNLRFDGSGGAVLGYRVAEHAAGRGVATAAVRNLCRLALARHGIRAARASTSHANVASHRVLTTAGFFPVGPAGPQEVGGKAGTSYERVLTEPAP